MSVCVKKDVASGSGKEDADWRFLISLGLTSVQLLNG